MSDQKTNGVSFVFGVSVLSARLSPSRCEQQAWGTLLCQLTEAVSLLFLDIEGQREFPHP